MQEEVQQGNGKKWFFGCCGGLILFMLLLGGGGYFGATWLKDKSVSALREGIATTLEDSDISQEESAAINAEMERLEAAVESWGLIDTAKHMGNVENVGAEVSTLGFHAIILSYAHTILPHTPMPEEERADGRRTLQRFARGVDEDELSLNQNNKAWHLKGKQQGDGPIEFDVEQVRAHLAQLKAQADAASIPDEPYEVQISKRLKTIVDAILAE